MVGRGTLIALEGIDGCGKTTQARRLVAWVGATRPERAVHLHREPGGTPLGEAVRELLLGGGPWTPRAETLLYMAARAELYGVHVRRELDAGAVVVVDRSSYSTAAYQGGGLGLAPDEILALGRQVTEGCWPDRVVLLRVAPEVARRRIADRDADRIEARGAGYFERVAAAYERFARAEPGRFRCVDAEAPEDDVERAVRAAVEDLL